VKGTAEKYTRLEKMECITIRRDIRKCKV